MHKFHNTVFDAPNVLELDVDPAIVAEFAPLLQSVPAGEYAVVSPGWSSDMKWISPDTIRAFRWFQSRFWRLGVAERLRPFLHVDQTVRVFSGFLVARSYADEPVFHKDWLDTNNEAFTLLTPITEAPEDFGLVYKRSDGSQGHYAYKRGKAVVFGDDFVHSTQPGRSEHPVVLLCFTFGTDQMEHWPAIERTSGTQGNLMRLPDGRFLVHDIDDPETTRTPPGS